MRNYFNFTDFSSSFFDVFKIFCGVFWLYGCQNEEFGEISSGNSKHHHKHSKIGQNGGEYQDGNSEKHEQNGLEYEIIRPKMRPKNLQSENEIPEISNQEMEKIKIYEKNEALIDISSEYFHQKHLHNHSKIGQNSGEYEVQHETSKVGQNGGDYESIAKDAGAEQYSVQQAKKNGQNGGKYEAIAKDFNPEQNDKTGQNGGVCEADHGLSKHSQNSVEYQDANSDKTGQNGGEYRILKDAKPEQNGKIKQISNHVFHRRFSGAGTEILRTFGFINEISDADLVNFEDIFQAAMSAKKSVFWYGKNLSAQILVEDFRLLNRFECVDFIVFFDFGGRKYEFENSACKILEAKDGSSLWILAESVNNYTF